jgi:predicted N-acetyltransferase YhbS
MPKIRPLTEADLPQAQRIIRRAFGTFFGVPDLDVFWTDVDYAYGRFGAGHVAAFAADQDDRLVGSNFAVRWGSVGFFGPLSIDPEHWDGGIGQRLVRAACEQFEEWGIRHAGLFTFAQSAKHVGLYGKFGFYPRFLTAVMTAPARPAATPLQWARYSALPADQRDEAEGACRAIADAIFPGLDLGGEIRTAAAQGAGDTVLLGNGDSRLVGFAVCRWGPASEAGTGNCLIRFAAALPDARAQTCFDALLDACGALAASAGLRQVVAPVNLAREEAYKHLLARGYRTETQGVTMHRPNEPGYSRPGLFVLDDWR